MPKRSDRRPDRKLKSARARRQSAVAKLDGEYRRACEIAVSGNYAQARRLYQVLEGKAGHAKLRALIANDLAALKALDGDTEVARTGFETALKVDGSCEPARANLETLFARSLAGVTPTESTTDDQIRPQVQAVRSASDEQSIVNPRRSFLHEEHQEPRNGVRVAILSFLFNWPSTGGGIIHTVELAQFLARAGFEVRHFYAKYPEWGVGKVESEVPFPSEALEFDGSTWTAHAIQERFRDAVRKFDPHHVIITDSWNFKPLLAEAVQAYPYILRLQAMECNCPLNNVRFLPEGNGRFRQCRRNQLADRNGCVQCVRERGQASGSLHQAERTLSGVETPAYSEQLARAFREAEAVLVVNPLTEALVAPFSKCVRVATAGMDPARFPWPFESRASRDEGREPSGQDPSPPRGERVKSGEAVTRIFFAGLVEEWIKGFYVLQDACHLLWQRRRDFELIVTGDPPGQVNEFTRFVGWLSQDELPRYLRSSDVLVMPTIAQEALGRTAVEAMAAGRPVVASRLGGLPFTVIDGQTGLLFGPGNPADLAEKIALLLDSPKLRERLGLQGRLRFVREYSWDRIIERHYKPLLLPRQDRKEKPLVGSPTIKLSLIVSVLDSHKVVRRQLLHLNSILPVECELILVDDGSEPSLQHACDSVPKTFPFRLLFTHDKLAWTQPRARNLGASVARGEKLLFFDIDHIITDEVLRTCLEYRGDKLHWHRRPGILDHDGRIVTDEQVLRDHGLRDELPGVHLNSFMIRRDLFDLLGGYDERFCGTYGGDDVDFTDRYNRLCQIGVAKPDECSGVGYAYPDPATNAQKLFHSLQRHS